MQTVGEDELPAGMNRVIVEREGEQPILLINGEPARCWRMMLAYQDEVGTGKHGGAQVAWPAPRLVSRLGIPVDGVSGWQAARRAI